MESQPSRRQLSSEESESSDDGSSGPESVVSIADSVPTPDSSASADPPTAVPLAGTDGVTAEASL